MQSGRRKKVRYVQHMPKTVQFSPRGKAGRPDEIELTVDQFEALKLADYQGYHQDEGAQFMRLSRPTFGRILRSARQIIADALVNSKTIRIRIGDVQIGVRHKDLPIKKTLLNTAQQEKAIRHTILEYSRPKSPTNNSNDKRKRSENQTPDHARGLKTINSLADF